MIEAAGERSSATNRQVMMFNDVQDVTVTPHLGLRPYIL